MENMLRNPLLWLVPAGIAMAFGVASTTIATIGNKLTVNMTRPDIILTGGISGIALGLTVIVLGYYFDIKPSNKMQILLTKAKLRNIEFNHNEDSETKFYLDRVRNNTLRLTKNLVRLGNLIRGYSLETPPKDWQIVRYNAARSMEQIEELYKRIILDFGQIVDIINNPRLVDLFGIKTLHFSEDLIHQTLKIDPENDIKQLIELRRDIREQISRLEKALELLDQERKRINDY
jgi:hypothetical protein